MTNTTEKKVAHCEKHDIEFTGICGSCIGEFGFFDQNLIPQSYPQGPGSMTGHGLGSLCRVAYDWSLPGPVWSKSHATRRART